MDYSINKILEELCIKMTDTEIQLAKNFNENGYCIIPKSDFIIENLTKFHSIVDDLIKKESWRGGWEGKEEYMKVGKKFNNGAYRLANLFNKNKLFLQLLTEKNLLKVVYGILEDDVKIGALDMREPLQGTGGQDLHIDWLPKKSSDENTSNIVCFIFLDKSDESNGTMRLIPKTHKKIGWIENHITDKSNHPDAIPVTVNEGSIVLMDGNLWHSGTTNVNGKRRRVLYLDIRRRNIPQLLNQKLYLDESTLASLDQREKFLLGVSDNDITFDERVYSSGTAYRKEFQTDIVTKEQ